MHEIILQLQRQFDLPRNRDMSIQSYIHQLHFIINHLKETIPVHNEMGSRSPAP